MTAENGGPVYNTPVDFECPHCGQGYTIPASESLFVDDIEDRCADQCEECKGWYQLRCVDAKLELQSSKAAKDQPDQS